MAREIVITSVPRGVKLGRTGFQVAMRTAGLRDDVSATLERMAGYRHLAAGEGANPVCYFHRRDRTTGAGPIYVLGRIVDAGVDFSNRSNKLAHMVILDPGELAQVAASPASLLAAIEGRLVTRWTGGPEERKAPFSVAGIPATNPAPCVTWQQVMGDAGWAGVIAERAIANQPTLLIGPAPSPASCRRMLTLFEEALAIVPPAKRWEITFDTTTLAPNGILWRGTYVGSPESQALQPGLLVVDLCRPQPIPADMAAGPLVNIARTGSDPVSTSRGAVTPVGTPSGGVPAGGVDLFAGIDGRGLRVPIAPPPPPPEDEDEWEEITPSGKKTSRWLITILAITATAAVLLLLVGVGVGAFVWRQTQVARTDALRRIQDYAANLEGSKAPTKDDVVTAREPWREGGISDDEVGNQEYLAFLNAVLASKEVTEKELADTQALEKMLEAVADVRTVPANESRKSWPTVLGRELSPEEENLLVAFHSGAFPTYGEFRDLADGFQRLVELTTKDSPKDPDAVTESMWALLTEQARADGVVRDYHEAQAKFVSRLVRDDLVDKDRLLDHVRECAHIVPAPVHDVPMPDNGQAKEANGAAPAGGGKADPPPADPADPDKAFEELQAKINPIRNAVKNAVQSIDLPQLEKSVDLLCLSRQAAKDLDVDVVVGMLPDFPVTVKRDDQRRNWQIMLSGTCLMTITLEHTGTIALLRGDATDEVWKSQERYLRFMPIGFKRQNHPLDENDVIVLTQPEDVVLQSKPGETLQTLLCGDQGSVPLPANVPRDAIVKWKPRSAPINVPPLGVSVACAEHGEGFQLAFTATVGGNAFALKEDIRLDDDVRRKHEPWPKNPSLFGALFQTGMGADDVRKRLGLRKKDGIVSLEGIPKNIRDSPAIIEKILDFHGFDGVTVDGVRKDVLVRWVGHDAKKKLRYEKLESLQKWGEVLREYIEKHDFGNDMEQQFVRSKGQRPEATRDLERLRAYFAAHKPEPVGKKESIDSELAAICVLLELDNLIVAKAYREELEALLPRIPISALFEGKATYDWTIEIATEKTEPYPVTVAVLKPAQLLPGVDAQPASIP